MRRLSSMLEKVGLLHKGSENMIAPASQIYLEQKKAITSESKAFKATFARECPVYFIGVFDTVAAVTNLAPRPKLDGTLSKEVRFAYHAVSIDEVRLQFPPNLWLDKDAGTNQTVEQVWFVGVHSDVGGSYSEAGLSDIALSWMAKKAVAAGVEIKSPILNGRSGDPLAKLTSLGRLFGGLYRFTFTRSLAWSPSLLPKAFSRSSICGGR